MPFLIKIMAFIFLFVSIVCSQNTSRLQKMEELQKSKAQIKQFEEQIERIREHQQEALSEVLAVSESDEAEAAGIGAKASRLFPDGVLDEFNPMPEDSFGFSIYSFTEISDYYFAPRIEYKNNALVFTGEHKEAGTHGFFGNLGQTPPETIGERHRAFIALAAYEPPAEAKNVNDVYSADGFTFRNSAPVAVGTTYLVRGVTRSDGDGIFAVKIHRKEADGSIVIFVKLLKRLKSSESENAASTGNSNKPESAGVNYETAQKIENALQQKGFYNVTVDSSTVPLTLRGHVPKGKLAEVVQIAQETVGKPVTIQLTEQ